MRSVDLKPDQQIFSLRHSERSRSTGEARNLAQTGDALEDRY